MPHSLRRLQVKEEEIAIFPPMEILALNLSLKTR
jgi:hypothetical protein